MLSEYECRLLNSYLANIAAGLSPRDPAARELVDWVSDRKNRIAFPEKEETALCMA